MKLLSMIPVAALALSAAMPATAAIQVFTASLPNAPEVTPNDSPGTGSTTVTIDDSSFEMRLQADFTGLASPTTVAHIHCCTAVPGTGGAGVATGVPTLPGFPAGVTFGTYDATFDMNDAASWNPAFITNNGGTTGSAFTTLLAGLNSGSAYLNIHSELYPAGEIRGFLASTTTPIPEPQTYALMLVGLTALGAMARRRRHA